MLILLAACRYLGRETRPEGSGQGLEAVEDGGDALLLGEGRDGELYLTNILLVNFNRHSIMQSSLA